MERLRRQNEKLARDLARTQAAHEITRALPSQLGTRIRALASTDPLTGGRRALPMWLTAEHRCRPSGGSAGFLPLDVDDLKGSNNRGHAAGDEIMWQVAAVLRQTTPRR